MIITVNALAFLFLIQSMLIAIVFVIFYYQISKKEKMKATIAQSKVRQLLMAVENQEEQSGEVTEWKEMFKDLQSKFDQIRKVNKKLTESITSLVPKAEKSKEYENLIAEIENNNEELDSCIGTMKEENANLGKKMESFRKEVQGLSTKLDDSINKSEFDYVMAEKNKLELNCSSLKSKVKELDKAHKNLQKNYVWLEKEYNALYENISNVK